MTPVTQQLEDKKKELLRLDKYINKYRKAHCPICKEKMSCFEDIEKHKKLTKHFGDYAEDLNLNERKMFQLEEYNIRQAEIAILEQAIAEMQKQRQEILDKVKEGVGLNATILDDRDGSDMYLIREDEFNKILEQLNQPKTED